MSGQLEKLYKIQKKDIPKAGAILADAFQEDPVWERILADVEEDVKRAFFQGPARYCHKYGEVFAPSERLEGIAGWVPGDLADMTIWRMILCGSLTPGIRKSWQIARISQKMLPIFEPLEKDRKSHMQGRGYIYLMVIGVATEFQAQGFGGQLLRALFEKSEQAGVPIYLETETERNVRLYEGLGFKAVSQISLPVLGLPMWEMIREAGAGDRR